MGEAIGGVLGFAIGVAISPVPIIAVILILFSPRSRVNGLSFLIGWLVGLTAVVAVVYLVADAGDVSTDQGASDASYWLKLGLGVLLLLAAGRRWRRRPQPGETPAPPKWMAAIDSFTPVKSLGLAVLLSAVNPKNLALAVAAAASVAQVGATTGDSVIALAVFVLVASLSIAVPVVVSLAGGERAATMLDGWKTWLSLHNTAVMAVLFLVFGAVLIGESVRGLSA